MYLLKALLPWEFFLMPLTNDWMLARQLPVELMGFRGYLLVWYVEMKPSCHTALFREERNRKDYRSRVNLKKEIQCVSVVCVCVCLYLYVCVWIRLCVWDPAICGVCACFAVHPLQRRERQRAHWAMCMVLPARHPLEAMAPIFSTSLLSLLAAHRRQNMADI